MSDAALDTLVAELRATAPPAPDALRARVESIAAREAPEPRRLPLRDRIRPRRLLLVAAPATFAVMLGIALAHGLSAGDAAEQVCGRRGGEAGTGDRRSARGLRRGDCSGRQLAGE